MVCLAKSLVLVGNFGALASVSASRTSHPHINIKSTFDDRRCLDAIRHSLLSDNADVTLESVLHAFVVADPSRHPVVLHDPATQPAAGAASDQSARAGGQVTGGYYVPAENSAIGKAICWRPHSGIKKWHRMTIQVPAA